MMNVRWFDKLTMNGDSSTYVRPEPVEGSQVIARWEA